MKKKTHRTHSTYSNYSPAHPPLCLQPLGLHNKMFPFETLLYHILVQNTSLPWCLITQECEWIPTNLVPKLFGKQDKVLNTPGCYNKLQQCESSYTFPGQENQEGNSKQPTVCSQHPLPILPLSLASMDWISQPPVHPQQKISPNPWMTPLLSRGINHLQVNLSIKNNQ